ncbi:endonuclease/exonuclease/phosphatase family protein [Mumia sp. ZJ1417]|uniref:endonuclease/exonuclease/phosphatase family protein n=1 Tax=Mumia sp. ZJ1417 TaxID=2708082 RepID=UPI0014202233|nr:endonuclease/exonuclease/phosphatase family protein [Mumia sp. ZJ1417]QMW65999.1 endonuclease/exonuclease/phosphatase family protein [Mumia sp. ZJ1417]
MTLPPRTAATLVVAVGVWVLGDLVRVWAPSLITIFGQAASTPPELMGAYALGCVAVGAVVALLARRHATGVAAGALAVALVCRTALQLTDGGQAQLVAASLGIAAGIAWLSLAATSYGDVLVVGLAAGLSLGTVTHAALGTWGAVWRGDAWGWVLLVVQVVGAAVAWRLARDHRSRAAARRTAWLVMPGLLLAGIVFANAGRASAVAGTAGLVVVALASVAAVATAAVRPRRATAWAAAVILVAASAVALLVTADVDGIPAVSPTWTLAAYAVGLPALTHLWAASDHGRPARAATLALGGLVWVALLFVYYAGYDLGYRADIVVVLAAAVLAVVAATGAPRAAGTDRTGAARVSPVLLGGLGLLAGTVAWLGPGLTVPALDDVAGPDLPASGSVRVTAYNLRMGYGMDGTFRPDLVAETLRSSEVALLSEVDRGWYLNGGQDELAILERMLDRDAVFAPAADPVWGDAVLTALPVEESVGTPLPSHGAVTGAQALSVRLDLAGAPTWFVSTHLQPNDGDEGVGPQTEDLAAMLRTRLADGLPLVLGGDLNTQPGSTSYALLVGLGLVDALDGADPTSPADRPTARIDHLLVSPDLAPSAPRVGGSQASDHLPASVTLTPRG